MPAIERDAGLGTAYERIAVSRMLNGLSQRHAIERVLEGPYDGITGIRGLNSVPLARKGAFVDVVLGDQDEVDLARRGWVRLGLEGRYRVRCSTGGRLEVPARSCDLVWNFNCLPKVEDPEGLIDEMCEASSRFVMVLFSNTWNYGFPVHRLHHLAAKEPWAHGDISMMNARRVARMLRRRDFTVLETLMVDTPWWPDIDSPIEEVLATFLPFLRKFARSSKRLESYTWGVDELPYLDDAQLGELGRRLTLHLTIERMRAFPLKVFFAHHRGILAERRAR